MCVVVSMWGCAAMTMEPSDSSKKLQKLHECKNERDRELDAVRSKTGKYSSLIDPSGHFTAFIEQEIEYNYQKRVAQISKEKIQ